MQQGQVAPPYAEDHPHDILVHSPASKLTCSSRECVSLRNTHQRCFPAVEVLSIRVANLAIFLPPCINFPSAIEIILVHNDTPVRLRDSAEKAVVFPNSRRYIWRGGSNNLPRHLLHTEKLANAVV